jgi:hypothetical protein
VLGALQYKGTWAAASNTPAIPAASSTNKGWYYVVTGSCLSSHGYANVPAVDFNAGDWIVSNGTGWEKADSSDQVSDVNGRKGSVTLLFKQIALTGTINGINPTFTIP